MEIFYGHVRTLEMFFSYDPDGKLLFKPFNDAYGTVHPDIGPGTGKDDVELVLNDGEYFHVWDTTMFRIGERSEVNFLHYRDAYRKALTCGEQGSIARITIVAPDGYTDVTALAADGTTVVMGRNTKWRTISIPERIRFLNRPATQAETA
ncbi:hypothetical protein [Pseudarthrobacter chlorophenolicus]|nr:hypothetical protein [Pseudarthrobacter chlorophenolicus]